MPAFRDDDNTDNEVRPDAPIALDTRTRTIAWTCAIDDDGVCAASVAFDTSKTPAPTPWSTSTTTNGGCVNRASWLRASCVRAFWASVFCGQSDRQ
jgi:hypothetical protein